jgi:hypothetical protein
VRNGGAFIHSSGNMCTHSMAKHNTTSICIHNSSKAYQNLSSLLLEEEVICAGRANREEMTVRGRKNDYRSSLNRALTNVPQRPLGLVFWLSLRRTLYGYPFTRLDMGVVIHGSDAGNGNGSRLIRRKIVGVAFFEDFLFASQDI